MGFKEILFKAYNKYICFVTRENLSLITPNRDNAVFQRFYAYHSKIEAYNKYSENVEKIHVSKLDEYEKQEYNLAKLYKENVLHGDGSIDPQRILAKIDKIQLLKNIKLVEANEKDFDPDLVQLEKLKGAVILGEEGSDEKLLEFVKNKPYLKKYAKWADLQEQSRYQYLG